MHFSALRLGGHMDAVVTDTIQHARQCVQHLKDPWGRKWGGEGIVQPGTRNGDWLGELGSLLMGSDGWKAGRRNWASSSLEMPPPTFRTGRSTSQVSTTDCPVSGADVVSIDLPTFG